MEKVDYSKYLDESKCNFKLPIWTDTYTATYDKPFNFTDTTSEGDLSIDLDALTAMVLKDKKNLDLMIILFTILEISLMNYLILMNYIHMKCILKI